MDSSAVKRRFSPIPFPTRSRTVGAAAPPRRSSGNSPLSSPATRPERQSRRSCYSLYSARMRSISKTEAGTTPAPKREEHIMKTSTGESSITNHTIVSHEQWVAERKRLLAREKEVTRLRDQVARERRALPWARIEKVYTFDTPEGARTLADLFAGRRQLMVQHFMLGPGWEEGCQSCSFMADHTDGMNVHLAARDVTFIAVSRAPLAEIERFRRRMGWQFKWVSSFGSDFNHDFHVGFVRDEAKK